MILAKKDFQRHITPLVTHCDTILAMKIDNSLLKETIVICAYIPPIDSPYYKDKNTSSNIALLEDIVMRFQERYPQSPILICGDMNARIGYWDIHADVDTGGGD